MSYGVFAGYYDFFTANVDYKTYAQRIDKIIRSLGLKRGSLVDLGCGTASLSCELARLGYSVTGVDISCEMLSVAAQKARLSGKSIRLINQDISMLELDGKYDAFVCSLDGINHLSGIEAVAQTFSRVRKYLSRRGVFIFDVNTIYKHRHILADNCFIFDSDRAYLGWQNDHNKSDNSVDITLDFFVPQKDGGYSRHTEQFREKAYPAKTIFETLDKCGFRVIGAYDGLSESKPNAKTERILFAAVRK